MSLPPQEAAIRFGCFFGTLVVMALWEVLAPRRPLTQSKPLRWFSNVGLAMLNSFVWRVLMPAGAVGLAISVQSQAGDCSIASRCRSSSRSRHRSYCLTS